MSLGCFVYRLGPDFKLDLFEESSSQERKADSMPGSSLTKPASSSCFPLGWHLHNGKLPIHSLVLGGILD